MNQHDTEILDTALEGFQRQTNVAVEKLEPLDEDQQLHGTDQRIRIQFPAGPIEYQAQIKRTITGIAIAQIAQTLGAEKDRWLVITRYAYPQLAKAMRELGVQFIDTTGNAFIKNPANLILIQAHRRQQDTFKAREDLFGTAGIRVVFALLCREEILNGNYREIAQAAQAALGTVVGVMRQLIEKGFVHETLNKHRRLNRTKELLDQWTQAYANRLRPKRLIGRYAAKNADFWQTADLARLNAYWGGEIAGFFLTRYLKPEIATIYAHRPINELALDLKLRRDEQGAVEVRDMFWRFHGQEANPTVVPPLLAYADLMATGDARNIDTANMVYEQYLRRHIEQD